jgi:hypothetical protein
LRNQRFFHLKLFVKIRNKKTTQTAWFCDPAGITLTAFRFFKFHPFASFSLGSRAYIGLNGNLKKHQNVENVSHNVSHKHPFSLYLS